MVIECCSQERTYSKFYGLIGERFAKLNRLWTELFEESFRTYYDTIHRYETNRLRNIAKFFGHMLSSDALGWHVFSTVHLNEEETTASSRIFIKILFQDLSEAMGMKKLVDRLKDPYLQEAFLGLFPKDNTRNTRFSINYFTSIGMGQVTEDMREHLKASVAQQQAALEATAAAATANNDSDNESSSSKSSYSSYSSGSSRSHSYSRSRSHSPVAKDKGKAPARGRSYTRSSSGSRSYSSRSSRSYSTTSRSRSRSLVGAKKHASSASRRRRSRSRSSAYSRSSSRGRSYSRSMSPPPAKMRRRRSGTPVKSGEMERRRRGRSRSRSLLGDVAMRDRSPGNRGGRSRAADFL